MERYHIYKLGIAILFYAIYCGRGTVVNGLTVDDVTKTINTTDSRERRDSGDDLFFYQGADGTPGVDFPTLSYVPRTKFTCKEMEAGYYADIETDCQAFHICDEGRKLSFLCPNGTVFHQSELICDWWYKVNCTTSPLLYEESAEVLQKENARRKDARRYQGTKQAVFSSKEDAGYEHRPPIQFVTPSYPYKSPIKPVDNRISVSTESSYRRNYNLRGDRKLESFGNGVREGTSRTQNVFEQGKDGRGRFSGDTQKSYQGTSERNIFGGRGREDQNIFGEQKQKPTGQSSFDRQRFTGSGITQVAIEKHSQVADHEDKDIFGYNTQGTISSTGPELTGTNLLEKNNRGSKKTSTDDQDVFGSNIQEKNAGTRVNTFGGNYQGKPREGDQITSEGDSNFEQALFESSRQRPLDYGQGQFGAKTPEKTSDSRGNSGSRAYLPLGPTTYKPRRPQDSAFSTPAHRPFSEHRFSTDFKDQFSTSSTTERYFGGTVSGSGQNRFDIDGKDKSRVFEQSTTRFGVTGFDKFGGSIPGGGFQEDYDGRIPVSVVSGETQEPQETASFVKNSRNNLQGSFKQTTNPYPNHRETYSEIKDPRHYYEKPQNKLPEKPFYGSSIGPQVLSTVPVTTNGDSYQTTTEFSPFAGRYRTDISTTSAPYRDDRFGSTKSFAPKSSVTTNRFSFGSRTGDMISKTNFRLDSERENVDRVSFSGRPTDKSATVGVDNVDINIYDKGRTIGVDTGINSVSSTFSPDISNGDSKSKLYPGSQSTSRYDSKSFGFNRNGDSRTSTPSVGISNFGFGGIRTTERTRTDSPIIKVTVIPSTAFPGYESGDRTGKSFEDHSSKTQIIRINGFKSTTDNSKRGYSKNVSPFGYGEKEQAFDTSLTTSGYGKFNAFSPTTPTNLIPDTVRATLSPSISRFDGGSAAVDTSTRFSTATEQTRYEPNLLSTISSVSGESRSTIVEGIDTFMRTSETSHGRIGSDSSIFGRGDSSTTPSTRTDGTEFNINDNVYTSPTPTTSERFNVSVNDETYSTPSSGFSISGRNEIEVTSTGVTPTISGSTQSVPKTSFSSILQPKPFSSPTGIPSNYVTPISGSDIDSDSSTVSQLPPYRVSSASPFATTSKQVGGDGLKTPAPTLPTLFTTVPTLLQTDRVVDENVNNMVNTLMQIVKQRLGGSDGTDKFSTPRPGLVVPPSAGPQTLHTLAIYFANALDNLTASSPRELQEPHDGETETDSPVIHIKNEELIKSLLTQMTIENYDDLFQEKDGTTTETSLSSRSGVDDNENDLNREDTKYPTGGTPVRQLARVFTEALSAYLDDPDTFRKVLQEVRPTEPPLTTISDESAAGEEDEVLNYSDSDLKGDRPHLPTRPTPIPVSPTWGYILAFNKSNQSAQPTISPASPTWGYILGLNKSDSTNNNLESRNSLNPENENLQSADSQSFVSQFNKVTQEYKTGRPDTTKGLKTFEYVRSTAAPFTDKEQEGVGKTLPAHHWTTSSDVAKLFHSTLAINPISLNEGIDSSKGFTSSDVDGGVSSEEGVSELTTVPPVVSEIQYELRALPKIELNSTQVHGILIDFMNETRSEGSAKLHRLLDKLNITQEEFLNKMKEIEGNPLTRRLILLLISECNTDKNKELETRSASPGSVFNLAQSKSNQESHTENNTEPSKSNSLKEIVHPSLEDNDEDTRALDLLNSLYVIASKFGK